MIETVMFDSIIDKNFSAVQNDLSQKLQKNASEAGWPQHIVNALYIDFMNGTGEVEYPKEYAKEIEDLEYGTPGQPPKPFLRLFKKHTESYNEFFENTMMEILFDSGVIF
jgi:hypothetical protein